MNLKSMRSGLTVDEIAAYFDTIDSLPMEERPEPVTPLTISNTIQIRAALAKAYSMGGAK